MFFLYQMEKSSSKTIPVPTVNAGPKVFGPSALPSYDLII
jgi:hypothetical protein